MIQSFKNQAMEDIFNGINSKNARNICPKELWRLASRKLDHIDSTERITDIKIPTGNRLEALKGDRHGQYNIRINEQYRICFVWEKTGPSEVEITDYH